jgi:anti-sigma factor RsiW
MKTSPCRDHELSLSLRAAGALEPDDAARLEGHLVVCPACRAEAEALAAALDLAKLPPVSDAERRAYQYLGDRTLAALRRKSRVRSIVKRAVALTAAAAAAAALVLAPAVVRRDPGAPAAAQVSTSWLPDLDTLWNDASVVDLGSSALADGSYAARVADLTESDGEADTETDAALAALEL